MKKIDLYIGNSAPSVNKGAAWLKPVNGGFALYVLDNGWKPLKLVDDKGTPSEGDDAVEDVKTELIGDAQDEASANTINGAKAYADSLASNYDASGAAATAKSDVIGATGDTGAADTIYGAKAYATSVGAELVGDATDASSNMTLYGIKKYIDEQIEALG